MGKEAIKRGVSSRSDELYGQKILTQEEVKKLIDYISDMRDKLSISILYETGCSLGELVEIKVEDINKNEIRINSPESKEVRVAKISFSLANKIYLYVKGNALEKSAYIFSTKKSDKISVKRVREIIQNFSEKIGYGKINPQMFRYFHIAHAYKNGVFLDNISSQLGIKRGRVFQILEEMKVVSNVWGYESFLNKMEDKIDEKKYIG